MRSLVERTIIINAEIRCAGAYRFAEHSSVSQHVFVTYKTEYRLIANYLALWHNLTDLTPGGNLALRCYDSQSPNLREWSTRI